MDRAVALDALKSMTAADQRPVLSDVTLGALLDQYASVDSDGLAPTDAGWTGTWYLNAAAAEGWRRKAAAVAGDFTFSADGASYDKGSVLANCERMVALYAAKDNGTVTISDADPSAYRVENLIL